MYTLGQNNIIRSPRIWMFVCKCVLVDKPAMARPHWSRSQATAHARVLPVVGLVVTKRTKSALATPSAIQERFIWQYWVRQSEGKIEKTTHCDDALPSTYAWGSCTPPSWPQAEYPLSRRFPLTGSTARAFLNHSTVCPSACQMAQVTYKTEINNKWG